MFKFITENFWNQKYGLYLQIMIFIITVAPQAIVKHVLKTVLHVTSAKLIIIN